MPIQITDRTGDAARALDAATRDGIMAAVTELRDAVKRRHYEINYYKGGRFRSTLQVAQRIASSMPYKEGGAWAAIVSVPVVQALYWELGHMNVFTRKYERVEIWRPTLIEKTEYLRGLFARVIQRRMPYHMGRA